MSIQFSGISSGLPVDSIVSQLMALEQKPIDLLRQRQQTLKTQQLQYDAVASRVSTLQTALQKLTNVSTTNLTSTSQDLFRNSVTSTADATRVTATATSSASPQSISVLTTQLATATRASSQTGVGQLASGTSVVSDLAQGRVTAGNFTVYVNGAANTLSVASTDTLNDVLSRIQAVNPAVITGASVGPDGKIQLATTNGANVQLGGSADTSNFLDLTQLKTGTKTATSITSASSLSTLQLGKPVDDSTSNLSTPVTAGSQFKIGTATFNTTGKSLSSILSEINASSDAGVSASFNTNTNKIELTSKSTGSGLISLQDVSGNFLAATGLITGGDTTASQTLGLNAQFSVNGGSTITSASNSVSDGITGLTGVTLNLLKSDPLNPTTVSVSRSNDSLKTAINEVLAKFNEVISFIDSQTKATDDKAALKNDSSLIRFRNKLRQTVSDFVSGQAAGYGTVGSAGLSTGSVSATVSGSASPSLQFDSAKFDAALAANPEAVRSLFIGTNGAFTKLSTQLTDATSLDPDASKAGLFKTKKDSLDATNTLLAKKITEGTDRLTRREKALRLQFQQSDKLIAQYQSQGQAIANIRSIYG